MLNLRFLVGGAGMATGFVIGAAVIVAVRELTRLVANRKGMFVSETGNLTLSPQAKQGIEMMMAMQLQEAKMASAKAAKTITVEAATA